MSNKDIADISKKVLENLAERGLLRSHQLEYLLSDKNEKWNTARKEALRDARFKQMADSLQRIVTLEASEAAGTLVDGSDEDKELKKARKGITGLTNKEIELAKTIRDSNGNTINILTDPRFVNNMSQSQFDHAMKSDAYLGPEKENLKTTRHALIDDAFPVGGGGDAAAKLRAAKKMKKMDIKEMLDLRDEAKYSGEFLLTLTTQKLKQIGIVDNNGLEPWIRKIEDTRVAIDSRVRGGGTPVTPEEQRFLTDLADWLNVAGNKERLV